MSDDNFHVYGWLIDRDLTQTIDRIDYFEWLLWAVIFWAIAFWNDL